MSIFLKEFKFEKPPIKITYFDKEPLILNNKFIFYHNRSKFRKELTRLQYLIKSYTKTPLLAVAIRDSLLKEEYSEKFLIVLFTTSETIRKTNKIIEEYLDIELDPGCFFIETKKDFMLLLSKDIEGLISGVDALETILKQILEDYMNQERFDDYIKIRIFELIGCTKSP
ncbi:MAG: hypothetical protein ACFFDN_50770 [Candidatus Hodarchaeota archaeon]